MVALYSSGEAASKRLEQIEREKTALADRLRKVMQEEADIRLHFLLSPDLAVQEAIVLPIPMRRIEGGT